jgi:hypothetical protein
VQGGETFLGGWVGKRSLERGKGGRVGSKTTEKGDKGGGVDK